MKKLKAIISTLLLAVGLALPAMAQTDTNAPMNPVTFGQSVMGYFTTFTTNDAKSAVQLWTGTANVGNSRMEAEFGFSVHPELFKGIGIDTVLRNDVTLGSLASAQGGLSYNVFYMDVDLAPYIHMGYETHREAAYAAPGLRVTKNATQNAGFGVSLELPIYWRTQGDLTPTYGVFGFCKF